jgi:RNA polymerase sigma factor (sigma-70 family)
MPTQIDGRALYDACRAPGPGQADAFQALGRYLYQVAYNLVRERAQLRDLAEDCSQEALVTIWRSLDSVEDPDRFLGWAGRVVINKMYDACRRLGVGIGSDAGAGDESRASHRRRIPLGWQDSLDETRESGGQLGDVVADSPAASPEASQARHEMTDVLTQTLARHPDLSDASKIVLIRGFLNDWDDAMLAAALKTTRSNVHTIRSRDLAHLRADAGFLRLLDEYMKE